MAPFAFWLVPDALFLQAAGGLIILLSFECTSLAANLKGIPTLRTAT